MFNFGAGVPTGVTDVVKTVCLFAIVGYKSELTATTRQRTEMKLYSFCLFQFLPFRLFCTEWRF